MSENLATTLETRTVMKPLGTKAYGSIGHLPLSRVGPGDWHVPEGQARICCEQPRKGDRIIVTEKLDGACVAVAKIDGAIVPLIRAGYRAEDGKYEHLRMFAPWVEAHRNLFDALLSDGERIIGEWLALAHGTLYDRDSPLFQPFVAFDLFRNNKRVLRDEFRFRLSGRIVLAHCIFDRDYGCSVAEALDNLHGNRTNQKHYGFHGATEPVEGAVWRVEREGRVDFLAKYVRPDKVDGRYLENVSGRPPVWNWKPSGIGAVA